jgi:hypothetical protein
MPSAHPQRQFTLAEPRVRYRRVLQSVALALGLILTNAASSRADDPPGLAAVLDGLSGIPYESNNPFAIGDGVNVNESLSPRERCVEYKPEQLLSDTSGSTASGLDINIVRDYDEFQSELKFSLSMFASANANLADIAGGSTSLTGFGKYENFLSREKTSVLLVLNAHADQGRNLITDYSLKAPYQALIDAGKFDEFVKRCGTHFIRGWTRSSSIKVLFTASELDQTAKTIISTTFDSSAKGNFKIADIGGGAETKISSDLSTLLATASKLGKLSHEITATGGLGVPTLGKTLDDVDVSNPTNMKDFLKGIVAASADFSLANSAPDRFIFAPYPQLEGRQPPQNLGRFDHLGKIYKALMTVDEQLSQYKDYKTRDFVIWNKYFRVYQEKIAALRQTIVNRYISCRQEGKCDLDFPAKVDGLLLDDILFDGILSVVCPQSFEKQDQLNPNSPVTQVVLSSVIVRWEGQMRYLDDIDLQGAELEQLTPDLKLVKLPFDIAAQLRTTENPDKTTSGFITVHREQVDQTKLYKDGKLDFDYVSSVRRTAARSIYIIKLPTNSGIDVESVMGYPNMAGCKVLTEN